MKFLFMFSILLLPIFNVSADVMDEEESQRYWEAQIAREEGDMQSELNPIVTDEVPHPEIERQEEPFYPEGEMNDYALGSEELAEEEYE